ncbi:MAG: trypsin-like peptidase domain-containing protein [Fimbriimonadaceae bacterium]|jgi:S1-C subfamily serine protease|nr:trypsin-like peptidase domain-containing protein [Fimbriimonadaceae bacterium]
MSRNGSKARDVSFVLPIMSSGKSLTIVALSGLGVFGLVFGALQLDRFVRDRAPAKEVNPPLVLRQEAPDVLPAQAAAAASGLDFRPAARRVLPSVVSIDTWRQGEDMFTGQTMERQLGSGSGVIISRAGYVVTNNHVLQVGRSRFGGRPVYADRIVVTLSDGRSIQAKLIGADPKSDLAVIQAELPNLSPIELGDSGALEVGEWVMAVGNPLGYSNTLSVGVVSNVNRPLPVQEGGLFGDAIQTDAAINQGNSGGALTNAKGQLVGINTAIASIGGGSIGIGFAIPVNRMKTVVDDIVKLGYARYGELGVGLAPRQGVLAIAENRALVRQRSGSPTDPPRVGALILSINEGGAADRAGIRPLDIILGINGKPVRDLNDFRTIISPLKPDERVSLRIWSRGQERQIQATLTEAPR